MKNIYFIFALVLIMNSCYSKNGKDVQEKNHLDEILNTSKNELDSLFNSADSLMNQEHPNPLWGLSDTVSKDTSEWQEVKELPVE